MINSILTTYHQPDHHNPTFLRHKLLLLFPDDVISEADRLVEVISFSTIMVVESPEDEPLDRQNISPIILDTMTHSLICIYIYVYVYIYIYSNMYIYIHMYTCNYMYVG